MAVGTDTDTVQNWMGIQVGGFTSWLQLQNKWQQHLRHLSSQTWHEQPHRHTACFPWLLYP
jgi:hypothetical protein